MLRQATIPAVTKPVARSRLGGPVPWLVGLAVVLAIALLAMGAVYAAPMLTTTPNEALADGMIAAWNAHDPDATRAYYTDNAIVADSANAAPDARGLDEIGKMSQYGGYTVTRLGPVNEHGNLVWWLAHIATAYDVAGADAIAVMILRDGKIFQHWVIWE